MELRWLEGNWKWGRWKLQYRPYDVLSDWIDVGCVESPKEQHMNGKLAWS